MKLDEVAVATGATLVGVAVGWNLRRVDAGLRRVEQAVERWHARRAARIAADSRRV